MGTCARCDGTGTIECWRCGGSGKAGSGPPMLDKVLYPDGLPVCKVCEGTGELKCPGCQGSTKRNRPTTAR